MQVYQTAIMVAMSIIQHPEEWTAETHYIKHKIIGNIWTANGVTYLKIDTPSGTWIPNFFERRIIYEAVAWRLDTYIRNSLQRAMLQHHSTGKIIDG